MYLGIRNYLNTTMRRRWLDRYIRESFEFLNQGLVLDVGGVKRWQRGDVEAYKKIQRKRLCLNISPEAEPDLVADACYLPIKSGSIETVVCFEVLEYIEDLGKFVCECSRVLKSGGRIIISWPFMHGLHGDSDHDKLRFTSIFVLRALENAGFEIEHKYSMGGISAVVFDFLQKRSQISTSFVLKVLFKCCQIGLLSFAWASFRNPKWEEQITTGFFVTAKKGIDINAQ